jgi:hypothetical protein
VTAFVSSSTAGVPAATSVSATSRKRAPISRTLWSSPTGWGTPSPSADINFRASSIAEREGKWLVARTYAERAKELYSRAGDRGNVGRVLNDLGGIIFLIGDHAEAIVYLRVRYLCGASGSHR